MAGVYRSGVSSFGEISNIPRSLRLALEEEFFLPDPAVERITVAADGTRKLLLRFSETVAVETVVIPDPPRLTLCLSSQAGCGMGCRFCATARLGLMANLDAARILAQVKAALSVLRSGERVTNIVFMGMGEPLANYANLVEAIEVLTAPWGYGLSGRRITVSTVGLLPQMERLVRETPVQLAVSLHAATNELRTQLVPINRYYSLEALIEVCRQLPLPQRRRITFEYVLLAGVNDRPADARRLSELLRGVRAKVNLIPFNPFPDAAYSRPSDETVRRFQGALLARGVPATVRRSRGLEVQAACGQLALTDEPRGEQDSFEVVQRVAARPAE
ncbi:MAG: dual-specificity RNA methyltransferase RlmN [Candidatus Binatia bacterium]|nr:MAG: dual-specificity RNA methyltransferase RlmN [Candidatus Binatia bacterium]